MLDLRAYVRPGDGVWWSPAGAEAIALVDALLQRLLPGDVGLVQVSPPPALDRPREYGDRARTPRTGVHRAADVDVVVTEHGTAWLRGLGVAARAERLVAIAAPEHRDDLLRTSKEGSVA